MQKPAESHTLKRCLGLCEAITITTGTVIGVGLFTVGANVVGILGHFVIFATLSALLISIYPSLLYAEMGAALPFSGGTYRYAALGLGRPFGVLSGWCFIISMVSVASGEALAFSFYLRTLFEAMGISIPFDDRWIACLAIAGFLLLTIRGVAFTGRIQNGLLFFFWGVAVVWILSMLPSMHFGTPVSSVETNGFTLAEFFPCVAMVWWCFAGFETCCAMGEEIKYPQINLPRALILAPFLVFSVNGLFQWALVSIVPPDTISSLAEAAAPYAEGMKLAGVAGFPLILLCLGIAFGGDFSTLNASVSAPSRYLYTMARDGVIPSFFGKLSRRYQTPVPAILVLGVLMLLLVATNSLSIIASLSLFATLLYYIVGMAAACGLRIRRPNLLRPYRAPLLWAGAPVSIILYIFMMFQLQPAAVLAGIALCVLGLILYAVCHKKVQNDNLPLPILPPPPDSLERKKLDRQFHIWCIITALAAILVLSFNLAVFW